MKKYVTFILWFLLMSVACILTIFSLFFQTTPYIKNTSIFIKLLVTELSATVLWAFAIPAQRIGYLILTPFQLSLSSEVFTFASQLLADKFWLKKITTIDDYVAMVLILFGMVIAKLKLFG